MRPVFLASMCAVMFLSAGMLSGCATRQTAMGHAPPPPPVAKASDAKSNRFNMTQNGRRMKASDFDAWMKARGIRIAKGPQRAKAQVRADAPKPKARPKRR